MLFTTRINTKHRIAMLAVLSAAACTHAASNDDASSNSDSALSFGGGFGGAPEVRPTAQGVGGETPAEAAAAASMVEIGRGYVTELKNSATYNNPTGGLVKVHVTGCALTSLSLGLLSSDSQPVFPIYNAGGSIVRLAFAQTTPTDIHVDGTNVYWSNQSNPVQIWRVAR